MFKFEKTSSRYSINDEEKENLFKESVAAPFLFDKMMERQSLIFEHFTLAIP